MLREGERYRDVRYGEVEILAVQEKRVYYLLVRQGRVHHTSKRRAQEFRWLGPEWADGPRWQTHLRL